MKRMYKFLLGIGTIVAMSFLVSCEGPAGPAGADGIDGADGTITCLECHSNDNVIEKQVQFYQSGHYAGIYSYERTEEGGWSSSCARCHSSEGFLAYANDGENIAVATPGKWECKTCHGIHTTFEEGDYALRMSDAVAWNIADATVDFGGSSNLCVNCHQSRTAEPNTAAPADSFKISNTHYGPHHGPQANVVNGFGFAEIAGTASYPAAGSHQHFTIAGCTGCHMGDYADNMGGHTWNPNLAACNSCHATDDFDYGGVQTTVGNQLDELRDLLITAGVVEYVEADAAYEPVPGTYTMVLAQAYYNWVGLSEDRSLGAHNPKYVEALLNNTIDAIEALQ
jgi:hypothetical protein